MPALESGKPIEQLGVTPRRWIAEAPWGEVWRADHAGHGRVLLAAYSGVKGEAHFERVLPRLSQWNRRADVFPGLIHVLETHRNLAIPCLILRDPGGPTLAERVAQGPLGPADASKVGHDVANALHGISNEGICPFGLAPDNIIARSDYGWMLAPYALLDPAQPAHTSGGAWAPPGLAESRMPEMMNPDVYALSLILAGAMTGDVAQPMPPDRIRTNVPHKRLSLVLSNGVAARSGNYPDAKVTASALERYRKGELQADLQEAEEAVRRAARSPLQQKLFEHRGPAMLAAKALGLALVVFLAVFGLYRMFAGGDPAASPRGLTRVYFEALIARDGEAAARFTEGEATLQTFRLLEDIKRMEDKALASRFATVNAPRMGDPRTGKVQAKTQLVGQAGDPFIEVEFVLERKPDDKWKVVGLLYEPLRKEGTE